MANNTNLRTNDMDKNDNHKEKRDNRIEFKGIYISNSPTVNYLGAKNYRTLWSSDELEKLYVDVEAENASGQITEGVIKITISEAEANEVLAIESKIDFHPGHYIYNFELKDLKSKLKEGIYFISLTYGEANFKSAPIQILNPAPSTSDYIVIHQISIDRVSDETEEENKGRQHSFKELKSEKTKDVRIFLLAENKIDGKWIYEFDLFVTTNSGRPVVNRRIRANNFVQDNTGKSYVYFGYDIGQGMENLWERGTYNLAVSFLDKPFLMLSFCLSDKDVPYSYEKETNISRSINTCKNESPGIKVAKQKEAILDELYRMVGLRKVKDEITRMCEYAEFIKLRRENGFDDSFPSMNMLFTGSPGTGKNTVARMIGEIFFSLGLLTDGRVFQFERKDLVIDGQAVEEKLVRQAFIKSTGGVLFINDAGDLWQPNNPEDRGIWVLKAIIRITATEPSNRIVILADNHNEISALIESIPDLAETFPRHLYFEDYTAEELMEIARNKSKNMDFRFSPGAEEKFQKLINKKWASKEIDFTNGRFIDEEFNAIALRMSKRLMSNKSSNYKKEDLMLITEEDIELDEPEFPDKSFSFEGIVGRSALKKSLMHHLNYIYFIRERQKQGFADEMPPLHTIFTGNPGTGKMTVARMLTPILLGLDILRNSNISVQNGKILSGDIGMSPEQAAGYILNAAEGGMLYINNIVSMFDTLSGAKILELIINALSSGNIRQTVMVVSDTKEAIDDTVKKIPFLNTFFAYRFDFRDYTETELFEIAVKKFKDNNYTLDKNAAEKLKHQIERLYSEKHKKVGNTLMIEKIVNLTIHNLSERTMDIRKQRSLSREEITMLKAEDIPSDNKEIVGIYKDDFDDTEIDAALEDLNRIIGQEGIKKQIRDFVQLAKHYNSEGIKLNSKLSLQWSLIGNSGFEKGEFVHIISKLYKAMGITDKDTVYHFKADHLIGQAEEDAQKIIGQALEKSNGGILLFDEDSPRLYNADNFKERVHAMLINQMAIHPGAYMVVYAKSDAEDRTSPYETKSENAANSVNVLVFEDYDREELMDILKQKLDKENMVMTKTAKAYMAEFISLLFLNRERISSSYRILNMITDIIIRNCIQRHARNKISAKNKLSVYKTDVKEFDEDFIVKNINERKRIGFV